MRPGGRVSDVATGEIRSGMSGIGAAGPGDPGLAWRQCRVTPEMTAVHGRDPASKAVADDAATDLGDTLGGEPELLEDRPCRRRRAVMIEPDDRALVTDPPLPPERDADLDADTLADGRWQDLVPIRLILGIEPFPARERHHAGRDPVLLERLGSRDRELELRARAEEDELRAATRGFAKDVAAARDAVPRQPVGAWQRRQLLPREREGDRP